MFFRKTFAFSIFVMSTAVMFWAPTPPCQAKRGRKKKAMLDSCQSKASATSSVRRP
jgi:hypothetical protein